MAMVLPRLPCSTNNNYCARMALVPLSLLPWDLDTVVPTCWCARLFYFRDALYDCVCDIRGADLRACVTLEAE